MRTSLLGRALAGIGFAVLVAVLLLAFAAWLRVRPMAGEWTMRVPLWQAERAPRLEIGVARALHAATDPALARWLDGRTFATPVGALRVDWQRATETLVVRCAPCTLRIDALGPKPLVLPSGAMSVRRDAAGRLHGRAASGLIVLAWTGEPTRHRLVLLGTLEEAPIADLYALFGSAVIPELERARIDGRVAARFRAEWPEGRWSVQPAVEGFAVEGLGTEALIGAAAPGCSAVRERLSPWLERAVVAAEDQRFFDHPGYDLDQLVASFESNQRAGKGVHGGSTLTQQLAKLLYTGDERSAARKLRELLYAVELERTLGKPRILALYLALAPWGDGVCGASQAARHHFGKPARELDPIEAAWLATLLSDPHAPVDTARLAWVLKSMAAPPKARQRWIEQLPERLSPSAADAGAP